MKRFSYFTLLWGCLLILSQAIGAMPHNVAQRAKVTASSVLDEQHGAQLVNDGTIRIPGHGEWVAQTKTDMRSRVYPYPWIQLDWDQPISIQKVLIYDRPDLKSHSAAGTLLFSDGSKVEVNTIPNDGSPKVVEFTPRSTQWIRFQVTDGEGVDLGLSEIEVFPASDSYEDYVSWVDPFIETAKGRYFFFVTGSLPFGMVSAAPLTRNINQGGGGYNYNSTQILGFPQIHNWMISGVNLMPVSGEVDVRGGDRAWRSSFSHDGEIAQPGYHRLFLEDYKIWVEQTVTERVGMYRLTYAEDGLAQLLLNLGGHLSNCTILNAHVTKQGTQEISGYFDTAGRVWGGVDVAKVYFVLQFQQPLQQMNGWVKDELLDNINEFQGATELIEVPKSSFKQSPASGVAARWGACQAGDQFLVKSAISYVSVENARENILQECPGWDFDDVRKTAFSVWNEWLGRIEVSGGENEQITKFYTDLWHVLLGRHIIDDYNGQYPDYLTGGTRIGKQTRIHTQAPRYQVRTLPKDAEGRSKFHMYNSDALWLTQWNLNTLWGIAYPGLLDDFSASMLEYDKNGGLLPRGPSIGSYTYIMTGCPATSLITSAFQRGIHRKYAPKEAYAVMKRNHGKGGMLAFDMDKELDFYVRNGYCPDDAGLTIQWAFEDWALGQMALRLGKQGDYRYFTKRAQGWPSSFHPTLKLMMPRKADGSWYHEDPLSYYGFVQANGWQATFGLSHDIPRLADMMGGADSLAAKLNQAFEHSRDARFLSAYVSYANQPGCSNAHVFSHVGKPWLSQYWVRQVREKTYGDVSPAHGYGENDEDQGQMAGVSALMSLGLFSLDGGSAMDPMYDLTGPIFDEITIHLDPTYYPGKEFRIRVHGNARNNYYIQKATLNGAPHSSYQISHADLVGGGSLELWLGPEPNCDWGISSPISGKSH